jgi:hypothetical protein
MHYKSEIRVPAKHTTRTAGGSFFYSVSKMANFYAKEIRVFHLADTFVMVMVYRIRPNCEPVYSLHTLQREIYRR